MKQQDNEKPSSVHVSSSEGLSVLTSVQSKALSKYLDRPRKSFDVHAWDGNLVQAWKEVFQHDTPLLEALESSINDVNCTKTFADWGVTKQQFYSFQGEERKNGLHYSSVRAACALVKEMFTQGSYQPVVVTTGDDLLNMWSSPKASAGVINIQHSKKDSVEEILRTFKLQKAQIEAGTDFEALQLPAMMFHRSQISGFIQNGVYSPSTLKKKDRFVWGLDGASVSIEGQYANPAIQGVSNGCNQYAGGKSPEKLRRIIHKYKNDKSYWVSTDYSSFDQTIPSWLIYWCFDVIKSWYDARYWKELDWIAYNFVNTKVAIPGVGVLQKHHGIPSGSNFTQLVGSMANAVMALSYIASTCKDDTFEKKLRYVRKMAGTSNGEITMLVMGDDNLLFTNRRLNLAEYSGYVERIFGVSIKPEKCDEGSHLKNPVFLKREWRVRGEYQDPMYMVINTSHPERKRSYEGYSPWHILYGLFLTYSEAFPSYLSERFFLEKMEENGGIEALGRIPRYDLPGVFRAYGEQALDLMQERARHLLNVA